MTKRKTTKDWSALPERAEEELKRNSGRPKVPRGRGAAPLGPFTKKAAQAMHEAGKKTRPM